MGAAEEIASILKSTLSSDEKSMLLHACWDEDILSAHTTNNFSASSQDKTEHKEGSDVISKRKDDESPTLSSSQESKGKGALDPTITEEILAIWKSDLPSDEKQSLIIAILLDKYTVSPSQDKTTITSLEVNYKSLSDETSKEIDKPSSFRSPDHEEKGIEASDPLIKELKEKPADIGTHDHKNSPLPEQATSTIISSQTKLGEISLTRMVTKESRQVAPADSSRLTFEATECLLVSEPNSTNDDGIEQGAIKIHKQGAACKHCHKLILSEETHISIAKCDCSSTLIHNQCANAWSHEKGNVCSYCDQDIRNNEVTLSLIPPQTTADNSQIPTPTSKRFWCCFS